MTSAPLPSAPRSAARWTASLVSTAVGLSAAALVRLARPTTALRIIHGTCDLSHRIFELDVRLQDDNPGDYSGGSYVFVVLNQTSLLETFLLPWLAPVPYRIIVNIEYALMPIFGWSSVPLGARVIIRQWPAQAKRAIQQAIADLRGGDSYIISIEGRRSPDGALQPYKKGAVVMAIEAEATIIPVVLRGARERLPFGAWRVRPGPVEVHLLPAIDTHGLSYDDRDQLVERLRTLALAALEDAPAKNAPR